MSDSISFNQTNAAVIGVGVIASSIITGFLTSPATKDRFHFFLSPRNAEKCADLKSRFPEHVTVCASNQDAVDRSEWVFLTVLPRDGREVVTALSFRPNHKILSIMSDHFLKTVTSWTGPVAKAVRMVPLPFAALHEGPIAFFPEDAEIRELFGALGTPIAMKNEAELSVISGLTGIMSAFYMLLNETSRFGAEHGLSTQTSVQYMTAFFGALCRKAALREDGDLKSLAFEMTPGGLNELALTSMLSDDAYRPWTDALAKVMNRLDKKQKETPDA